MACTPTRLELSNTDATTVDVTVTSDPGDGTAVVLEVPSLSISKSSTTSGGTVSYSIAAQTGIGTNSLWEGTIQVGANAPADIVVQIVETAATQSVGITVSDAGVTYCAPTAPGGGGVVNLGDLADVTFSLPLVGKEFLQYNGTNWQNAAITSTDVPSLDASKIASGTFVDARIAESSVTQHAAAIDLNDLGDVNIATGAGNDGDLVYFNNAGGAGDKFKGVARSSIGLSEFNADIGLGDLDDVSTGLLTDNMFIAYTNATSTWTGRSPAAARTALGLGTAATTASTDYATAAQGATADSALQNVVEDTTPQLGGNLDVNGQSIVSASAGNILITPDTTGKIVLDGLSWPTSDGTADQVLKTDGTGNLSFATVSGGGGGSTDWIRTPSNTTIVRLFDDMLWGTDRNHKAGHFYSLGVSSSYWEDCYAESISSGESGVIQGQNSSTYSRLTINGPQVFDNAAADGTEFLFEGRFAIQSNVNNVNRPVFSLGVFCPKTEHNSGSTEQGPGYGDTAKAGVHWTKGQTYWRTYHYDVEGTNGGTTEADLTSFPLTSELTWFRCAVHCYKETIASVPTWTVRSYIDGTLAATQYLTSGTEAPVFYVLLYNAGENYITYVYVDWLMFQYTRPNAVSYLDIEDLP